MQIEWRNVIKSWQLCHSVYLYILPYDINKPRQIAQHRC